MMLIFETPQGVNGEAARDFIVAKLDIIAEQIYLGGSAGTVTDLNGHDCGRWIIAATQLKNQRIP